MEIVISGLGSVGTTLMQELVDEGHNIVVIDINAQKIENAVNKFDVKGVIGNGASASVLKEAGVQHSDLFIGATNHDELNILCCIIAKNSVQRRLLRVRPSPNISTFSKTKEIWD